MDLCDLMPDDSSALSSKLRAFPYASQNASRMSITRQHNPSEPLLWHVFEEAVIICIGTPRMPQ